MAGEIGSQAKLRPTKRIKQILCTVKTVLSLLKKKKKSTVLLTSYMVKMENDFEINHHVICPLAK